MEVICKQRFLFSKDSKVEEMKCFKETMIVKLVIPLLKFETFERVKEKPFILKEFSFRNTFEV